MAVLYSTMEGAKNELPLDPPLGLALANWARLPVRSARTAYTAAAAVLPPRATTGVTL